MLTADSIPVSNIVENLFFLLLEDTANHVYERPTESIPEIGLTDKQHRIEDRMRHQYEQPTITKGLLKPTSTFLQPPALSRTFQLQPKHCSFLPR